MPASEGRTFYETAAWGDLSTEEIEAVRGRMDAVCPELARTVKLHSAEAGLVIKIPGVATDEQIARLEQIADPAARQHATIGWVDDSDRDMRIFMVLLWNADHPVIGPAINRILQKRMEFSLRLREQAGQNAEQARMSMMYAYSVLLGLQLLRRAAPHLIPEGSGTPQELRDYVAALIRQAAGIELPTTTAA